MADSHEFRLKIREIVQQEYELEFLGERFEGIVALLTDKQADSIYAWIKDVMDRKIQPILIGSEKRYKDWRMHELLTFRHAFSVSNVQYRILFVKVKNFFYYRVSPWGPQVL